MQHQSLATGLGLTFLGVLAFSLTLPMTRLAITALEPSQVAVWRAIVAAILATTILTILKPPRPQGREWAYVAACAAGTVFGFPIFTTFGMQSVTASHGAVVVGLLPLATAVCGVVIGGERPSVTFWISAFSGTMLTVLFVVRQTEGELVLGHVWLLLAVIAAAIGYAYGGLATRTVKGWSVACWALVISLPVLLPLGLLFLPPALDTPFAPLAAFLYLAVVSQLLGFFAFYRGLALAGIARASQIQLLQLFMTIGFAAMFFGEAWDNEAVVFGAVVVLAVAVGTQSRIKRYD
ncbi:MAG: DMT family transporter [Litoreibacter sp.]